MKRKVAFMYVDDETSPLYGRERYLLKSNIEKEFDVTNIDLKNCYDGKSTNDFQNDFLSEFVNYSGIILECSTTSDIDYGWIVETVVEKLGLPIFVIARYGIVVTKATRGKNLFNKQSHMFEFYNDLPDVSKHIIDHINSLTLKTS